MKTEFKNYTLCVWPATLLKETGLTETDFEQWLLSQFKVKGKYVEEFKTLPDMENGCPVSDTGNRNDLIFIVSNEDVMKFAVPRLSYGISWWEDYVVNYRRVIPQTILDKYPDSVSPDLDEDDYNSEDSLYETYEEEADATGGYSTENDIEPLNDSDDEN